MLGVLLPDLLLVHVGAGVYLKFVGRRLFDRVRSRHLRRYLDLLQGLGHRGLELLEGGLRYFAPGLVGAVRLPDC